MQLEGQQKQHAAAGEEDEEDEKEKVEEEEEESEEKEAEEEEKRNRMRSSTDCIIMKQYNCTSAFAIIFAGEILVCGIVLIGMKTG